MAAVLSDGLFNSLTQAGVPSTKPNAAPIATTAPSAAAAAVVIAPNFGSRGCREAAFLMPSEAEPHNCCSEGLKPSLPTTTSLVTQNPSS